MVIFTATVKDTRGHCLSFRVFFIINVSPPNPFLKLSRDKLEHHIFNVSYIYIYMTLKSSLHLQQPVHFGSLKNSVILL